MLIAGLVAAALLVGLLLARWWAVALPAAIAVGFVLVSLITGLSLGDSPVAFLAVITTLAVGVGVLGRRRVDRRQTPGQIRAS